MLNPDKIKKSFNTHKTAIAGVSGVVVGLAAGCALGRAIKVSDLRNIATMNANDLLHACEEAGLELYAFTPVEAAKAGLHALAE